MPNLLKHLFFDRCTNFSVIKGKGKSVLIDLLCLETTPE